MKKRRRLSFKQPSPPAFPAAPSAPGRNRSEGGEEDDATIQIYSSDDECVLNPFESSDSDSSSGSEATLAPTVATKEPEQAMPDVRIPKAVQERASDRRAAKYGMSGRSFRRLLRWKVAPSFLNVIAFLFRCPGVSDAQDLDFIEYFAGVSSIVRGVRQRGYRAVGYDVEFDNVGQDINSDKGYMTAVQWMRRLRGGLGGAHFATVCSTWVWISRASTRRSLSEPLGAHPRTCKVEQANVMVSRVALLLLWLQAQGNLWFLEQPASSLMCHHPRMAQVKNVCQSSWRHVHTWMGAFGARTPKSTRIWSASDAVYGLHRTLSAEQKFDSTGVATVSSSGAVSGGPDLKGTQEYPEGYGQAVAQAWAQARKHKLQLQGDADPESDDETAADPEDLWEDAKLDSLAAWCGVPHDKLIA